MIPVLPQARVSLMVLLDVPSMSLTYWDGSLHTGALTIGTVNQGTAGASAWLTSENPPTTITNGKKTVTTAGTRVTLASSTAVKSVTIKALKGNTGSIYVGNSAVASSNGLELVASESVSLDIADLATVNLDCSVNGEGVTYVAVA